MDGTTEQPWWTKHYVEVVKPRLKVRYNNGQCAFLSCPHPRVTQFCEAHRQQRLASKRMRAEQLHAKGLCYRCGKSPVRSRGACCPPCTTSKRLGATKRIQTPDVLKQRVFKQEAKKAARVAALRQRYPDRFNQTACAICKSPPRKSSLHLDHCHKTGVDRGFLCNNCNVGLGFFKDDPHRLLRAAEYLKEAAHLLDNG